MTIKEVAQLAGVSPAAVSRYFNGGSLGKEKKKKIRKAVEQTGFRPNPLAQTMRTGKSSQIGVIVPKIQSDSVTRILEGISEVIRDENYVMLLGCTDHSEKQEVRLIRAMLENHVDGIIVMGRTYSEELKEVLLKCTVPVVITGQHFEGITGIYHDDFHAMKEMTELVLGEGRKRPAYIGAPEEDEMAGLRRREGFENALAENNISPDSCIRKIADFLPEEGERAMGEIMKEAPETDAVICASDYIALGAMKKAREAGIKMPEELLITGFGDSWAGSLSEPPLTTVHLFYRECGEKAASLLLEMIRNEDVEDEEEEAVQDSRSFMLGYELIKRHQAKGI